MFQFIIIIIIIFFIMHNHSHKLIIHLINQVYPKT